MWKSRQLAAHALMSAGDTFLLRALHSEGIKSRWNEALAALAHRAGKVIHPFTA